MQIFWLIVIGLVALGVFVLLITPFAKAFFAHRHASRTRDIWGQLPERDQKRSIWSLVLPLVAVAAFVVAYSDAADKKDDESADQGITEAWIDLRGPDDFLGEWLGLIRAGNFDEAWKNTKAGSPARADGRQGFVEYWNHFSSIKILAGPLFIKERIVRVAIRYEKPSGEVTEQVDEFVVADDGTIREYRKYRACGEAGIAPCSDMKAAPPSS